MLLGLTLGALMTNLFIKVAVARPRPYADENSSSGMGFLCAL